MSQQSNVVYVRPPSNSLGLAGFLLAVVGWFTCGLLCPIGFVLSLIGLRKQPRGFAIAGVFVGALGTVWAIVAIFFIGIAGVISCAGIVCGGVAPRVVTNARMSQVADDVAYFDRRYGRYPVDMADLGTHPWRTRRDRNDGWGHPLRLEVDGDGVFRVISDGPDGEPGTPDDIRKTKRPPHRI